MLTQNAYAYTQAIACIHTYTYKKICISTYFLSENTILICFLLKQKEIQVNISVVTVSLSDLKYFSYMQAVRIIVNLF